MPRQTASFRDILEAAVNADPTESIRLGKCMPPPIGCGEDATEFVDDISRREYSVSGLCQSCQNEIFPIIDNAATKTHDPS